MPDTRAPSDPLQIGKEPDPKQIAKERDPLQIGKEADPRQIGQSPHAPHTLVIDIGGTGVKMIVIDGRGQPVNERSRELTPPRATPGTLIKLIGQMLPQQPPFERVSVGFPGVVRGGVVYTAANLRPKAWRGFDLAGALTEMIGRPVRVCNDADLQGYGVVAGAGTELVLTLGTGMGAALFIDGHLVPNLELGQHPYRKGDSYEDRIGEAARKEIGKQRWRQRVHGVFELLQATYNPDLIWIGGGNARKLRQVDIPQNGRVFENVVGLRGGVRLWAAGSKAGV